MAKESSEEGHGHTKLGQFFATAISGNDILSSALYVSGIAILFAGIFAPLVLLFIGFVLFLYKSVYTEVVEALPVNGGAYNCLLNGTSKTIAAIAGITTFLSYIATAVISAMTAVRYVDTVVHIPVIPVTIVVMAAFALLVISGLKDSAKVAFTIFSFHVITLTIFVVMGLIYYLTGHTHFLENVHYSFKNIIPQRGGILMALYLGFSASLLGVSGFESSANFVEEQKPGVFRKTLRNMLLSVVIFNPLISLVALNGMTFGAISKAQDFLLADAARTIAGPWLQYLVVIDAFFVLSGAVLTGYIGVSGLLSRMSADGCLPGFFSKQNSKGSFPVVVITFFLLCSSILIATHGDLLSLAGVYTIAFLGVMTMFAFGNLILKETRKELKRTYHAPVLFAICAMLATSFGIFGNIRIDPNNLRFFEIYFIPLFIIMMIVIYQDYILTYLMRVSRNIPFIHNYIQDYFEDITDGRFVAFVHNVHRVYKILNYINRNEVGRNVTLVHCKSPYHKEGPAAGAKELEKVIEELHQAGAFPNLKINVIYKNKEFGPKTIDEVSKELNIRKNRILIGSIHESHPFDYQSLGGVRIIF